MLEVCGRSLPCNRCAKPLQQVLSCGESAATIQVMSLNTIVSRRCTLQDHGSQAMSTTQLTCQMHVRCSRVTLAAWLVKLRKVASLRRAVDGKRLAMPIVVRILFCPETICHGGSIATLSSPQELKHPPFPIKHTYDKYVLLLLMVPVPDLGRQLPYFPLLCRPVMCRSANKTEKRSVGEIAGWALI